MGVLGVVRTAVAVVEREAARVELGLALRVELLAVEAHPGRVGGVAGENLLEHVVRLLPGLKIAEKEDKRFIILILLL